MSSFKFDKLNNIKVGFQVAMVTAIGLFALIFLAAWSFYEADLLAKANKQSEILAHKASLFQKIYGSGLQMRRSEKDYLARLLPKYVDRYNAAYAEAIEEAEEFKTLVHNDEEVRVIEHIISGFEASYTQFNLIVASEIKLGTQPDLGMVAEMNSAMHAAENFLEKVETKMGHGANLDILTVEMLKLRAHEKDFILHKTNEDLEKFDAQVIVFDQALENSEFSAADKAKLLELVTDYKEKFDAWSHLEVSTEIEIRKLSKIYGTIEPEILQYLREFDKVSEANLVITEAVQQEVEQQTLIALVVAILLTALFSFIVSRNISQKTVRLSQIMQSLAKGDLNIDIAFTEFKNEFGMMAKSLLVFKQSAEENIKSEVGKQARVKEDKERSEFLNNAIEEFKTFSAQKLDKVNIATSNLETASQSLSSSAEDMSEQSQKVQTNVDNTSANVSSAAAATEEMSASISEISERAASSTTVAQEAKKKTKETVDKIATLSESAKQIEQVVKLINEIAEQTNLLALNATIESARAGDAGRGFAVVANEVKSLAEQTSKATDQIATQIASIQQDSSIAAKAIADVEEVIASLAESSIGVAAAVEEQSSVIGEISSNVANASNLSSQSAESMGVVTDIIGTAKDISGDVSNLAADMKTQVGDLENDITEFLRKVSNG